MITLHELSNTPGARHRRKRVGRGPGSGMGKTCGRGHKGQMSRKGHKHKVGFEGGQMRLIRRLPKRGFNNFNRVEYTALNVSALNIFDDGADITVAALNERGLAKGSADGVKLLGNGKLEKKLTIKLQAFSKSAREQVESLGGACEVVKFK